jgi:hypothetical protein
VHHKACLIAALSISGWLAGCGGAAPSGFSKGDHWTLPLVGPLEDGVLLTPVTIRGKGPYLFWIDPDANISAIDQQIVEEAGLLTGNGPARFDETGTEQKRGYAELVELKVGDLAIDRRQVMLVQSNFYNVEGRRVNGVLGRDVLAGSLVFGLDRDQGIATLATAKVFTPPPNAITLKYESVPVDAAVAVAARDQAGGMQSSSNTDEASRVGVFTHASGPALDVTPLPRRVASAKVGDATVPMHLDLGGRNSELREELWAKAKLAQADVTLRLVDEVATVRQVSRAAIAATVTVGGAQASNVTLAPYVDKRFAIGKVDGSLGLDFFRAYAVHANWDADTLYLKPRGDAAATAVARIGRWAGVLPACPHPGCILVTVTATTGGPRLDVVRDTEAANRALEVRIAATATGKTIVPLTIELPAKIDRISGAVPPEYEGATLTVLDVSPFTRPCSGDAGCVFQLGAPPAKTP